MQKKIKTILEYLLMGYQLFIAILMFIAPTLAFMIALPYLIYLISNK